MDTETGTRSPGGVIQTNLVLAISWLTRPSVPRPSRSGFGPVQKDLQNLAESGRIASAIEDPVFDIAMQPWRPWILIAEIASLDGLEDPALEVGTLKINLDPPAGVVTGLDRNPVIILPLPVAALRKPLYQPS
jgi:hypothetical protein